MSATRETKSAPLHVIVTVVGGVADVICKPRGVELSIYEYDVEGEDVDRVDRDPQNRPCVHRYCEAQEEVVPDEPGWPKPADGHYSRTWRCPDCGRTVEWTYEEMAEAGNPICTDCDQEMELV